MAVVELMWFQAKQATLTWECKTHILPFARHCTRRATTSHLALEMAGNINGDFKTPSPHKNKCFLSLQIA
ncbi:unnamed protein product [Sphenostylis stenocarpa]|uniref:Uncharacterized protein n=1 Tax=Sphenostylis stenocarpa TaxID=92480 RepID=A0AA86SWT3_9FABA|nr:unnamed protein product [Sphenostylis stenocarpa]